MKKFIAHILIFSSVALATMAYILSLADGYSDSFYLKLTTPVQENLIIGTSKAAQGIQPQILKNIVGKDFYNYAFSIYSSPYGEVYLNSIKRKLNTQTKNGVFILTVDAWSICSKCENPENTSCFRENKSFLNDITNVCQNPNFKYLINYFDGKYYNILTKSSPAYVHNDGWLEILLNEDKSTIERRTNFTIKDYQENVHNYHFSNTRFLYLIETIDFLSKYGKVYLVRMPVHPELMKTEDALLPDFNNTIKLARDKVAGYIDLTSRNKDMMFTDGVHLNKTCGKETTEIIAKWITGQ